MCNHLCYPCLQSARIYNNAVNLLRVENGLNYIEEKPDFPASGSISPPYNILPTFYQHFNILPTNQHFSSPDANNLPMSLLCVSPCSGGGLLMCCLHWHGSVYPLSPVLPPVLSSSLSPSSCPWSLAETESCDGGSVLCCAVVLATLMEAMRLVYDYRKWSI